MTFENVLMAVRSLESAGATVSANAIVAALGGSKRDALRFLRLIRAESPPAGEDGPDRATAMEPEAPDPDMQTPAVCDDACERIDADERDVLTLSDTAGTPQAPATMPIEDAASLDQLAISNAAHLDQLLAYYTPQTPPPPVASAAPATQTPYEISRRLLVRTLADHRRAGAALIAAEEAAAALNRRIIGLYLEAVRSHRKAQTAIRLEMRRQYAEEARAALDALGVLVGPEKARRAITTGPRAWEGTLG